MTSALRARLAGVAGRLMPHLPGSFQASAFRRRPGLLSRVPAGQSVCWPSYLGDLAVWVDQANVIERSMLGGSADSNLGLT